MKAQYVGDIGDYGKVLILKHLVELGFNLGVNWIFTKDDNRDDGKHRDYIHYRGKHCLCCCDEKVFEHILPLAKKGKNNRKIEDLENLIRRFAYNVVFYSKKYESGVARKNCEAAAFNVLRNL
jgi:hypothetical protein